MKKIYCKDISEKGMAEGTYEYECMRAELLGTEKPEYDEFLRRQKEKDSQAVEGEQIDVENLKVGLLIRLVCVILIIDKLRRN